MKSVRLHIIIYILLTVILMALPYNVVADEFSNDRMCYLTKERGLPGETVNQIITDAIGQVWIATDNGVCRYNGRDLHIFPSLTKRRKLSLPTPSHLMHTAHSMPLLRKVSTNLIEATMPSIEFTHPLRWLKQRLP